MKRRVVVTGLGAVTPLGIGIEKSWKGLCEGRSGIVPISRFDTTGFRGKIAGEIRDLEPMDYLDRKTVRRTDRFIHYALIAAQMAVKDSGLELPFADPDRFGVVIGTALGGLESVENAHKLILAKKLNGIFPFFISSFICNEAAAMVAIQAGAKGPNISPVTACSAGAHSVGEAFRLIQTNHADIMLAGGTEAPIITVLMAGLDAIKISSARYTEPEKACRPFEKNRDGLVTAEGSGILVLEDLDSARRRNARIYGEIAGYWFNCDAYHITSPNPGGEGAARCMELAVKDAGLAPEDVDYINAHGTSTVVNDISETNAIKLVFGEHSKKLAVSSIKSMLGHSFGAAGAIEIAMSLLSIRDGILPPTINYDEPDPLCDLDYVPNVARKVDINVALSNSFGFGGQNATVIIKKYLPGGD
ncbi:MAG: beta-ketoacyl-ACP synthase II [Dehalococcoidia bacterium]|nr:beta-ketoacyl-ACP synthase II [Dehalococcoidia bacterium]